MHDSSKGWFWSLYSSVRPLPHFLASQASRSMWTLIHLFPRLFNKCFLSVPRMCLGFPRGASGKEPGCRCRRCKRRGFNPWVKKIHWTGAQQPTPVFFTWKISWTEEPSRLQSMGPQRVGHDWSDLTHTQHVLSPAWSPGVIASKQRKLKTRQKSTPCLNEAYILVDIRGLASPASVPVVPALWCSFEEPFSSPVMEMRLMNPWLERQV